MKIVFFTLFLALLLVSSSRISAQVSFTKGGIIDKSYASLTMVTPPVLGKYNDGFFILSSGLMSAKRIVQMNLDKNMNQAGEEIVVKLPKGKMVQGIYNIDHALIVVLWSRNKIDPFEFYSYDPTTSTLGNLLLSIPVDDYPGREELDISILNDDFEDFIGFIIGPKVEYAHTYRKVIVAKRTMKEILWSQVITEPFVQSMELFGEFSLMDLYFNDANTLVTRFGRPFLKEQKEEIQTRMYLFDGKSLGNIWYDQVIRSTTDDKLLSLPLPFISKKNQVEVYYLKHQLERGSVDLVKHDITGDEIGRFPLTSKIDNLNELKRLRIYNFLLPINSGFENGSFCFLISEQLNQVELYNNDRTAHKHFIVSFELDETGIIKDNIIDVGWPEAISQEFEGNIILSNSLDAIVNGELISSSEKETFDLFDQGLKKSQTKITKHYVLEGELYSFYSEYVPGNMTSQLVKWHFE